ncbi:MAG: Arp2/3 complex-activating protein rickA, partial [Sorangiineae bacterium PRO1]|nr:Arp2/3 complex-activating protein rickA [Sorangiineae bacterium PRO1]
ALPPAPPVAPPLPPPPPVPLEPPSPSLPQATATKHTSTGVRKTRSDARMQNLPRKARV